MTESVQVFARFRPLLPRESRMFAWDVNTSQIIGHDHDFTFDKVFTSHDTQSDVYDHIGHQMAQQVLNGFNACVLAYGQTASGKTFTMTGSIQHPGLIPRMVQALLDTHQEDTEQQLELSYIEIYQERLRDLLTPRTDLKLKLREREKPKEVYVENCSSVVLRSAEQAKEVLRQGDENRAIAETQMNEKSSRSHAVIILRLIRTDRRNQKRKTSRLFLVDLAGSEMVDRSGATGQTLEEAKKINKSLSCLAYVINALTTDQEHIPYRDSKLTWLLSDALGGNSKTALLLACSPAEDSTRETLNTLLFGRSAKLIKNSPKVNEEISLKGYQMMVAELQEKLRQAETGADREHYEKQIADMLIHVTQLKTLEEQLRAELQQREQRLNETLMELEQMKQRRNSENAFVLQLDRMFQVSEEKWAHSQ